MDFAWIASGQKLSAAGSNRWPELGSNSNVNTALRACNRAGGDRIQHHQQPEYLHPVNGIVYQLVPPVES
jgi:hypothetical protein